MRTALIIIYSLFFLFFVIAFAYNQYITIKRNREKPFNPWDVWNK